MGARQERVRLARVLQLKVDVNLQVHDLMCECNLQVHHLDSRLGQVGPKPRFEASNCCIIDGVDVIDPFGCLIEAH